MNFECPYCHHHTTITPPNQYSSWRRIDIQESKKWDHIWFDLFAITCPNEECKELFLQVALTKANSIYGRREEGVSLQTWNLLPESSAKVLPDYIPEPIKMDYYEACRIKDLSPKASATLSRRCLQWMIRDFYWISKGTLFEEINELEEKVDPEVWWAIDSMRSIWNIWAHMEKDINYIIDVDPDEAQSLIELIELLIDEWYIARKTRQDKVTKVKAIWEQKKAEKVQQNIQEKSE